MSPPNHDGIERMSGRRLARIGKVPNQLDAMMVPIPAPVPLMPLTEANGLAGVEVRGSTFAICRKRCVGKRGQPE